MLNYDDMTRRLAAAVETQGRPVDEAIERAHGAFPHAPAITPWISADVPARPPAVATLRRTIVEFARLHGAPERIAARAGIAVSEAVENVVAHAYGDDPWGLVHLAADIDDGDLEIVVADDGRGIREDAGSDGRGLRLRLIAAVTTDFAIAPRHPGLEVWMRFALRGPTVGGSTAARDPRPSTPPRPNTPRAR